MFINPLFFSAGIGELLKEKSNTIKKVNFKITVLRESPAMFGSLTENAVLYRFLGLIWDLSGVFTVQLCSLFSKSANSKFKFLLHRPFWRDDFENRVFKKHSITTTKNVTKFWSKFIWIGALNSKQSKEYILHFFRQNNILYSVELCQLCSHIYPNLNVCF